MTDLSKRAWDGMREEPETSMSGGTVMTNQTNEELREKINRLLYRNFSCVSDEITIDGCTEEIMSLIPQSEQLEVEIIDLSKHAVNSRDNFFILFKNSSFECSDYFKTKQEALDLCKRFNLKVVDEESK